MMRCMRERTARSHIQRLGIGCVALACGFAALSAPGCFPPPATDPTLDASEPIVGEIDVPLIPPAPGACNDANAGDWLYTNGNRICRRGAPWHGRGAGMPDTRACSTCVFEPPNVNELLRRFDELTNVWKANFVRLTMESYGSDQGPGGRTLVQWRGALTDPEYLKDLQTLITHATHTNPDVYVMLSLWRDPTITVDGIATPQTITIWERLAAAFAHEPRVIFGVVNEPAENMDGTQDPEIWDSMNKVVTAIRAVEKREGGGKHLVAVQGTGAWARRLDYYMRRPIEADGGANVIYEAHVYNQQSEFDELLGRAAAFLPIVIGEFGPVTERRGSSMSQNDAVALIELAQRLEIPYLAWSFHTDATGDCAPTLLNQIPIVDENTCAINAQLTPSTWGALFKEQLAKPW